MNALARRDTAEEETPVGVSSEDSEKLKARKRAQENGAKFAGLYKPHYRAMVEKAIEPLPFQVRAFETVNEWADDPTRNLIITGPVGTGKTLIAVRTARVLAFECDFRPRWDGDFYYKSRREVRFISAPIVLDELRRQFGKEKQDDQTLERLFVRPDVLFIDDFDKIYPTDWSCERLWLILDARMVRERATCVTSNLNLEGIDQKYGDAIASRLANNCRLIELDGEDQRVKV